jgi:hypothetical protein
MEAHLTTDPVAQRYKELAERAFAFADELAKAKAEGKPTEEIQRLEWALELARYVGD